MLHADQVLLAVGYTNGVRNAQGVKAKTDHSHMQMQDATLSVLKHLPSVYG